MPIIGSASVQIRAIDKFFERDVRAAVKKIKNVEIELKADVDLTKVNKKLRDLRYRMRNNIIQLNIQADTETIQNDFQEIVDNFHDRTVSLRADADTLGAETQLKVASRDRSVNFNAKISPEAQKALKGLFYTITGSIPVDKLRAGLLGLAGNFEGITFKAFAATSAITSLGAGLFAAAGGAVALGRDLGDLIGLAAAGPAAIFGMVTGIAALKIAWSKFGDAVGGDEKALATLPTEAQDAARHLKDFGKIISTPVKKAFWVELDGSLQRLADATLPSLRDGMTATGKAMGGIFKSAFEVMTSFADGGGLTRMFENSNKGWENLNKGVAPFTTAILRLGDVGSAVLPRLGQWFADLGQKFGDFIAGSSDAEILGWIEDGITSMKQLGSIAKDTIGTLKGIANAATLGGAGGLTSLADTMERVARVANSEPFKSRLATLFDAAGDAVDIFGDSIGKLFTTLGQASQIIAGFFRTGMGVVSAFVDNVNSMLRGSNFLGGLYEGLADFEQAVQSMEPGFVSLGGSLGNIAKIAGTVFKEMAPGFNQIMDTIDKVIASLAPGLQSAVPIFNEFVQGVLSIASGPIIALATGVGNLLTFFSQMPGPLQTIVMSLGAIALLRPRLEGAFTGIKDKFTAMRQGMDGELQGLSRSTQNMYGHFRTAGTHIGSVGTALRNIPFAAATSGMGGIATAAGGAVKSIGKAGGSGLLGALSGGAALLGGPWGIALAAGIGIISAFGQAQEESKARVAALSDTLTQQAGAVTNATKQLLAKNSMDGVTNAWDDFVRGALRNSKSVEESLEKLGISTKQYNDRLADSKGRDAYVKSLGDIVTAMKTGKPVTDEMAAAIGTTKEALKGINGDSMQYLAEKASNAAKELTNAEKQVQAVAKATGLQTAQAAVLAKNYETLASATTSANDKFGALKQNLDIISKGQMSFASAQKGVGQALDDTARGLKELSDASGGSLNQFYNLGKGFDFATKGGRDLHTSLESSSDAILKIGTAALDQAVKSGKSSADANSIAIQAMQPSIASLRDNLKQLGVEGPKIDEIIRSFGLMPDQIATAISVEGTEEAQRKIFLTKLAADSFASGNYVGVLSALPDAAKKAIEAATGQAGAFAKGDYDAILGALDKTEGGRTAALAKILAVSGGNYEAAIKALNLTGPEAEKARKELASVNSKIVFIEAQDKATGTLGFIQRTIDGITRNVKVTVDTVYNNYAGAGGNATQMADGGIIQNSVKQFANGGFNGGTLKNFANGSEKHVAQFAKAGAMRLWAEPETGGEAYIPLAKGKRDRSLKILEEVARIFGFGLHNLAMADGGTSASVPVVNNTTQAGPEVTLNVYPSPGLSPEQIGESAIDYLFWKIANK